MVVTFSTIPSSIPLYYFIFLKGITAFIHSLYFFGKTLLMHHFTSNCRIIELLRYLLSVIKMPQFTPGISARKTVKKP